MEERFLTLQDGHRMFFRVWKAPETRATLHINHGMAEHSARYSDFARHMNSCGFTVYAQDHRGHGFTKEEDEKGWFAEEGGWDLVCRDSWELDMLIQDEYPELPHFIFGHSMGSFIVRTMLGTHSLSYDGAIICGTGASMGLLGKIGRMIAKRNAVKYGSRMPDDTMEKLSFSAYGKHFPGEGKWGWLTKDVEVQNDYDEDLLCGFTCSSGFYCDLLEGIEKANSPRLARKIDKNLPLLIISGADDPVGSYGKGVRKVAKMYQDAGLDVTLRLYKGDRHEILNETDKDDVFRDILDFCLPLIGER